MFDDLFSYAFGEAHEFAGGQVEQSFNNELQNYQSQIMKALTNYQHGITSIIKSQQDEIDKITDAFTQRIMGVSLHLGQNLAIMISQVMKDYLDEAGAIHKAGSSPLGFLDEIF
jgi:replicative DNA helicase